MIWIAVVTIVAYEIVSWRRHWKTLTKAIGHAFRAHPIRATVAVVLLGITILGIFWWTHRPDNDLAACGALDCEY